MATEWISRDAIVAALDMCAVLAHYDIAAGRGTSFRICCPFHEDDRPSCSINPTAKVFNCFACGEQGNVLDFIAGMEDLDPKTEFRAVLETAIEIIGHNPTPQRAKRTRRATALNGEAKATAKAKANAKVNEDEDTSGQSRASKQAVDGTPNEDGVEKVAQSASRKRKRPSASDLSKEPDGSLQLEPNRVLEAPAFPLKLEAKHPWLDERLQRIGVSRSAANEFGIGFEGRSNALMANRICFPIHNGQSELVAYAGRWASDDADDQGRFFTENGREQPRYRLPKGFHKQLELFNWHRVVEEFDDVTTLVLVEGFWSVLRLQAMAIPSVALMGLSISDAQVRLLSEGGIRSVVLLLDGDEEGRAAAVRIIPRLASHFFIRSFGLPDGTKPDDVGLCVLNEVRALCAATGFKTQPAQPAQAKPALSPTRKSGKRASGKTDVGRREPSAGVEEASSRVPKSGSKSRKANPKTVCPTASTKRGSQTDLRLPTSSVRASFGWPDFD